MVDSPVRNRVDSPACSQMFSGICWVSSCGPPVRTLPKVGGIGAIPSDGLEEPRGVSGCPPYNESRVSLVHLPQLRLGNLAVEGGDPGVERDPHIMLSALMVYTRHGGLSGENSMKRGNSVSGARPRKDVSATPFATPSLRVRGLCRRSPESRWTLALWAESGPVKSSTWRIQRC
jgi:hypothetical protein